MKLNSHPVNALADSSKEMDEFDGFSESDVSEGEVSCLMYMVQDVSDSSVSSVSSVASEDVILNDVVIEALNDSAVFMESFDDKSFDNVDCSSSDSEADASEQPAS